MIENEHLMRQLDLIPMACLDTQIDVAGGGAVGGWAVLCMAKMGFKKIRVWDFDEVSVENMNSQFYRFSDIGRLKVEALREIVKDFTKTEIEIMPMAYAGIPRKGITISAVDSMKVRREIWEAHKDKALDTLAVIDPRMGAEEAQAYCMSPTNGDDIQAYEHTLYTDEAALQERCTAKATIYTATMLGGLVAQIAKDVAAGQSYARVTHWSMKDYALKSYRKAV